MRATISTKPKPNRSWAFTLMLIAAGVCSTQNVAIAQDAPDSSHEQRCLHRPGHGVESVRSQNDFATTLSRLRAEITRRPLSIVAEVDHRANAASAGLELRPTTTIIFGNPNVGTQLMLVEQSIGLELPLKMLVWQDACGDTRIDYTRPSSLKRRFHVRGADDTFGNITQVLDAIATAASSTG